MPIQTIEIICVPCDKCLRTKNLLAQAIKTIEYESKKKITYTLKHTESLRDIAKYSVNPSQVPIVIVNDKLELAGRFDMLVLKKRLSEIQLSC